MDLSSVSIETDRLLLVPITMAYLDAIFTEFTEEITTYRGGHRAVILCRGH